jgi:hypothetical protein
VICAPHRLARQVNTRENHHVEDVVIAIVASVLLSLRSLIQSLARLHQKVFAFQHWFHILERSRRNAPDV